MDANSNSSSARRGFTLVELLAVVVIIGILAALITAAAWKAMDTAKQAAYSMEMSDLGRALDEFKNVFGEYPPDFTDDDAVTRFISRKFPHYTGNWQTDLGDKITSADGASALVFWLGGMPTQSGGTQLTGFSKNPFTPFDTTTEARIGPFYKFKPERLGYERGSCRYYAEEGKNERFGPYVYFKAEQGRAQGQEYAGKTMGPGNAEWGTTTPHFNSKLGQWVQPDSFQIHCPGLDGRHGPGKDYPSGSDYGDDDYDDQTDFSGGPLSGKMP